MVKTSSQMKNMIEDYFKNAGLKYIDSTEEMQKKNEKIEWQLAFGATHITKTKNRDDRLSLLNPLVFNQFSDIFNKLPNSEKIALITRINEFIILKGMTFNWILKKSKNEGETKIKEPELESLNVSTWIDEEELSRSNLFSKIDNLSGTVAIVRSFILQKIKPESVRDVTKSSEPPKGDYFQ